MTVPVATEPRAPGAAFVPRILVFSTNNISDPGIDLAGSSHMHYSPGVNVIGLPCTSGIRPCSDGFFNEIHPKLRPVETVVDGVLIAGACQVPRRPLRASPPGLPRHPERGDPQEGLHEAGPAGRDRGLVACTACGDCLTACPYDAITMAEEGDRHFAVISPTGCKGCGGCVPICPENAIDLLGYTDAQVTAMIEGLVEVPA